MALQVEIVEDLAGIDPAEWNSLGEADYPFTRHEFLTALQNNHCLLEFGWQPVYVLLRDGSEQIIAGAACYIKYNSYGELVFDHSWANAYEHSGRAYYPKLVTAIPYTPATGPRLLFNRNIGDPQTIRSLQSELIRVIKQFCQAHNLSGWHCLFERETTVKPLADHDLLYRYDCQYHWANRNYQDFDDFLSALSSRKRKNIRRERASVQAEGLSIQRKFGHQLNANEWQRVHELYAGIFERKYGTPTLTHDFFRRIGRDLRNQVMVVMVLKQDRIVATSVFLRSDSTLYGRVWGCDEYYNFLHFECCYYQGIEFCIEQGLQNFDPGAQGEHKISRGFLPTRTCSAHWMVESDFQQSLRRYLPMEEQAIDEYCLDMAKRSPYRRDTES